MARKSREIRELSIRNIGVIEEATISFGQGFNVITGETGAGKTMVLTGLSLLSGARSDADLIRQGKERLVVSAQVAMEEPVTGRLRDLLTEHEPEVEDRTLLLQRSIAREGRGKAIIGSDPCTATILGEFADEFFTIHGQSTNQHLVDRRYQLSLLDQSRTEIAQAAQVFREALGRLRSKESEIHSLRKALTDRETEIKAISRFIADHARIKPKVDEWLDVEERIRRIDSIEEFIDVLSAAVSSLNDESDGAVLRVKNSLRVLERIEESDRKLADLVSRLRNLGIELDDINEELRSQLAGFDVEPGEIDQMRERRALLKQFLQRYSSFIELSENEVDENAQLNALSHLVSDKERLLDDLNSGDSRLDQLQLEYQELRSEMLEASESLRAERKLAAEALELSVNSEMRNLGLAGASFRIDFHRLEEDRISIDGADEIEFLFSAHEGGTMLPLNKGISGGELSRVMLAIELALVEKREIGTLVFDEIDAGIGGETGLIVGERIAQLADRYQVLVITHLAQVAAWADKHFKIEKNSEGNFVLSSVREIDGEERISEIARMLSGQSELSAARMHATELLKHAGK